MAQSAAAHGKSGAAKLTVANPCRPEKVGLGEVLRGAGRSQVTRLLQVVLGGADACKVVRDEVGRGSRGVRGELSAAAIVADTG